MSVLIKGMEMPKSCSECKFRIALGCCGNLPHNTRVPTCPLIELPPHGRWIDGDVILTAAEKLKEEFPKDETIRLLPVLVGTLVNNAPTIIEAEEETDGTT